MARVSSPNWRTVLFFLFVHLVALLALVPWFFSWTGVALCVAGIFIFGTVGMSIGYHRLFTHRAFSCPRWVERTIAILGCCCGEEAPAFWVAVHRKHHHHSDGESDPHSPLSGFLWGHVGWLLVRNDELHRYNVIDRYARDLKRDPFHAMLVQHDRWIYFFFGAWALFYLAGFVASIAMGSTVNEAAQFGLSLMVWGGAGAHNHRLAPDLVREFRRAPLGLSQLRDARRQPQQRLGWPPLQRRRMAQQPPCRSKLRTARA